MRGRSLIIPILVGLIFGAISTGLYLQIKGLYVDNGGLNVQIIGLRDENIALRATIVAQNKTIQNQGLQIITLQGQMRLTQTDVIRALGESGLSECRRGFPSELKSLDYDLFYVLFAYEEYQGYTEIYPLICPKE